MPACNGLFAFKIFHPLVFDDLLDRFGDGVYDAHRIFRRIKEICRAFARQSNYSTDFVTGLGASRSRVKQILRFNISGLKVRANVMYLFVHILSEHTLVLSCHLNGLC